MNGFRLGTILGFEIRVDVSWFVIFALILWSFSASIFPAQFPGLTPGTHFAMGLAGAFLFFASLLAHELSHSLVARDRGIPVEGITLFIFGGIAHTRMEAERPEDEFVIAGVGPLASLVIAALFGLVAMVGSGAGWTPAIVGVARYLAFLNAILAVFNLLPGFPLDGGRLFRAIVWKVSGNLGTATRWATNGGTALGYGLMGLGLLQLFAGAAIGGLWLVFIGWFLRNAAVGSMRQHVVARLLDGIRARDFMTPDPETVGPDLTLRQAVDELFLARRHQAFPVVEGGRPIGLLTLGRVREVSREEWGERTVEETMRPLDDIVVHPGDEASRVLEAMQSAEDGRVLVVQGDRLLGIISSADVAAWIQRSQALESLREAPGS